MDKLLIIGSGSQARYVIDIVREKGGCRILGIADIEQRPAAGKAVNGVKVTCFLDDVPAIYSPRGCRVIIAYGKNGKKRAIAEALEKKGFKFYTAVSPRACVSPSASVGEGSIINPLAVIMPNASVGRHVIIHSNAVIEHDNVIEDYANIGPGVSFGGRVRVKKGAYVYTGASVVPGITIGKDSVVGAGAAVIKDVADGDVVAGCPARSVKRKNRGK